jgi:hypothetical protein
VRRGDLRNRVSRLPIVGISSMDKVEIRRGPGHECAVRTIAVLSGDRGLFEIDDMMAFLDISGFWPSITEHHFQSRLTCMRQILFSGRCESGSVFSCLSSSRESRFISS